MTPTPEEIHRFLADEFPAAAGVECVEVGSRHAVARWIHDPSGLRPGQLISGPTQFSLADTALYFAVFGAIGIESMAVTADLSIKFLRPAAGGDLLARADLLHVGRTRIYGEIHLWVEGDADTRVAHATGTYVRPPKRA
ncbi:MAG: PaaI family thioesterase [Acidimicrobiia bacterium]|nr:PaaI family thioesterase [Acidimicrobiia bacterium]